LLSRLPVALDRPGIQVRTLVQLRWAAVAGQLATLIIVGWGLGFPIHWGPALAAVGASVVLNLSMHWLYRRHERIDTTSALVHLVFDLVQLSALLFLTGGLANPFSLLLLVPVTISATLLSARATTLLVIGALFLLLALWRWAMPLPWHSPGIEFPDTYRLGILIAIALGMVFLSIYAWQVSAEARRRQAALVATQSALDRESRMGALGALAAAAAHELGGPLGTITLIARDLQDALHDKEALKSDIQLLNQEVRRCRDILAQLAEKAEAEEPFPELPLPALLHEVIEPFEPTRVPVEIDVAWEPGTGPIVRRSPELLHGLHNLVSNALRHAIASVRLEAGESASDIWVAICDDGLGFSDDLLPRLGEPFLGPSFSRSGSTGLGIFIAATLLERTGGRLAFANLPEGGARVELRWHRTDIAVTRDLREKEGFP
jgi:two-component system, sensor histidine kinase RegB